MSPGQPISALRRTLGLACLGATAAILAVVMWAVHFRGRQPSPTDGGATPSARNSPAASPASVYSPPPVTDPALAKFVDRRAPIGDRVRPDQPARLPTVLIPGDLPAVEKVLLDTQDDDTARHEAAELLRRSNYPGLADALLRVLANPAEKERFRSFAVQHIGTLAAERRKGSRVWGLSRNAK